MRLLRIEPEDSVNSRDHIIRVNGFKAGKELTIESKNTETEKDRCLSLSENDYFICVTLKQC